MIEQNKFLYTAGYTIIHGEPTEGGFTKRAVKNLSTNIQAADDSYALKAALYQATELTQQFPPTATGRVRVELTTLVNNEGKTLKLPERRMFTGKGKQQGEETHTPFEEYESKIEVMIKD